MKRMHVFSSKSFFNIHSQTQSLLSASSILSRSLMAHNTTAFLDKLTCTKYVDFGKGLGRLGQFSWPENDFKYLDVELKIFEQDDDKGVQLVQNPTMREANFDQFMRLRTRLLIEAKNFAREKTCLQCWYQQCPKTWMRKSKRFTRWLTLWTVLTENYVWLYCATMWTSWRVFMLRSVFLHGRRRTRSLKKLSMWNINWKNLSIYLM